MKRWTISPNWPWLLPEHVTRAIWVHPTIFCAPHVCCLNEQTKGPEKTCLGTMLQTCESRPGSIVSQHCRFDLPWEHNFFWEYSRILSCLLASYYWQVLSSLTQCPNVWTVPSSCGADIKNWTKKLNFEDSTNYDRNWCHEMDYSSNDNMKKTIYHHSAKPVGPSNI